jgi:signal peptidase
MKALRTAAHVLSIVLTAAAAILLLGLTALPNVLGYKTYVVLSGSMEPEIKTGGIVLATTAPPSSLKVGDVIVYNRSDADERVTHRIVEVRNEGSSPTFITKGDANSVEDPWTVQYSSGTAGKVVLTIPYIGYISHGIESPQGRMLFLVIPVLVLSAMWLIQIWRPSKPETAPPPAPEQPSPVVPAVPADLKSSLADSPSVLPLRQ